MLAHNLNNDSSEDDDSDGDLAEMAGMKPTATVIKTVAAWEDITTSTASRARTILPQQAQVHVTSHPVEQESAPRTGHVSNQEQEQPHSSASRAPDIGVRFPKTRREVSYRATLMSNNMALTRVASTQT